MGERNNKTHPYYMVENFYDTNNVAYAEHKREFDYALQGFVESEKLKEQIKKYYNNEQYSSMLIFAAAQNLYISILKLCNEGLADVAGILLRSLFEDYIQVKYINKNKLGSLFINYLWISMKHEIDNAEKRIPESEIMNSQTYQANRALIYDKYDKYKCDYTKYFRKWYKISSWFKPRKRLQFNWSGKSLFKMAKDVGERASYNTIVPFHSKHVHCDPHGLVGFLKGDEDSITIENSASKEGIDLILKVSTEIFSKIGVEMAMSFSMSMPDYFNKFIKVETNNQ